MKCFSNSFCSRGTLDRPERRALLWALLPCLLFVGFLTALYRFADRHEGHFVVEHMYAVPLPPAPVAIPQAPVAPLEVPQPPDANQEFRAVPASYKDIDFYNRSYGTYIFPDGKRAELQLTGGQFRLFIGTSHWFDIQDVFYADVTGDGNSEAIVRLSHLRCIRTCDGTADLFYIYSLSQGELKEIWQFETGNFDTGCGLKSFTTKNQQLVLEMFGNCPQYVGIPGAARSNVVDKLTRLEFRYNGNRFLLNRKRVMPLPIGDDETYATQIRIADASRHADAEPAKNF